ncbi:hypothetical protein CC86DRAFT_407499 [Ophiobolus disseminans]|uniref:SOCS box domain-containing protein n=1 Tax=Ophiobolus disseminans TaxID=1469910 RepID=A0A6A6ZW42_9PLEO|nr:hypothetical protein CC86DRAFT_407499 [Ophiobolus disseminans]
MSFTGRYDDKQSVQRLLRDNPCLSPPMAIKIMNNRISRQSKPSSLLDICRSNVRQVTAHKRRGISTINNRVPFPRRSASPSSQRKELRLRFHLTQHLEKHNSRVAEPFNTFLGLDHVLVSHPEAAIAPNKYTTFGARVMWSPGSNFTTFFIASMAGGNLLTTSSSSPFSPAAKTSPATLTPPACLLYTSLDKLVNNLRDFGYLLTCDGEMQNLMAMLDDEQKPFVEAKVVEQMSLGISALLHNKDAPCFSAKEILKQAQPFITGCLALRNDLMNEDWAWATLGGPVYNLRRELKTIHDIFYPIITAQNLSARLAAQDVSSQAAQSAPTQATPPIPSPESASELEVRTFTAAVSPALISSNSLLLSFFANPSFALLLLLSANTLNERLDNCVKIVPSHVAVLLRACELITKNAQAEWFDWKLVAADKGILAWWTDMLNLHKKLGTLDQHKDVKGALGLKAQIWEIDKILRSGWGLERKVKAPKGVKP